jgi:hypothetical protein
MSEVFLMLCRQYGLSVTKSFDGHFLIGRGLSYFGSVHEDIVDKMDEEEVEKFIVRLVLYNSF